MFRTTGDKLVTGFQQQREASAFGNQCFTPQRSDYRDQKRAHEQQRAFNWVMHCTISPKRGLKGKQQVQQERKVLPASGSSFLKKCQLFLSE